MELTPVQRLVAFVIVVLVLAGLGAYLFLPKSSDGAVRAGSPGRPASTHPSAPGGSGQPQPEPQPTSTGQATPPQAGGEPDIYNWLPFTPSGLASAARVTTTFTADYGTFSYRQSTANYLAPMKPLMTSALADLIGRAYAAPGVVAQRTSGKQTSVGSAQITALRAYGPASLTFVVTLTVRTSGTQGPGQRSTGYAITVTGSGSSWQVSNIQLSSDGNQ